MYLKFYTITAGIKLLHKHILYIKELFVLETQHNDILGVFRVSFSFVHSLFMKGITKAMLAGEELHGEMGEDI